MSTSTKSWYSSSPGEPDGPSGLFLRRLQRHRRSCSNPPSRVRLKMPGKTKTSVISTLVLLVGAGGFEPPKLKAADLQSVPIGHSGTRPYSVFAVHGLPVYITTRMGSLSTSFAEFLDFCAESKNTKAKAAQKSTFLSGFLELVTGVERATGIASLKNGDFYTKICTFSCLFLVPSCTAHTPTKAKVC